MADQGVREIKGFLAFAKSAQGRKDKRFAMRLPRGLKPHIIEGLNAALKRRSFTLG